LYKPSVTPSNFFSIKAISHWNNLPNYVVAARTLYDFKNELVKFFCEKVTDIEICLLYFLTLLTTSTVFPLTNKLFTSIHAIYWSPCYMTMMTEATLGSSHEQAPKACDGSISVLNKSAHNEIHCGYSGY